MKSNAEEMHKKEMPTEWRSVSSSLYNNQSDKSSHDLSFPKELFEDLGYYMEDMKDMTLTIGRYRPKRTVMLLKTEMTIFHDQFIKLNWNELLMDESRWISGKVFDSFAYINIDNWQKVSYVTTNYS